MRDAAALVALVSSIAAIVYSTAVLIALRRFWRRERPAGQDELPGVTILKPLCGLEYELEENLQSFCRQAYPAYQVIFGVLDPRDPALAVAERVKAACPDCDIALVAGGPARMENPKIANLANMFAAAKHDVIIMADGDMRVDPQYLRSVVGPFADQRVGAVTCLYRGVPAPGVPSALGAMHIQDEFAPSVLVAAALERLRFCFGATMAVRRDVLEAVGGLRALGAYLADDYRLGKLVSERGYDVELSPYVVSNVLFEPDLRSLWLHELRWARTIRTVRPAGYALSFVTNGIPLALIYLALSWNAPVGLSLLGITTALRVARHYAARTAFGAYARATPWLIPLRDGLSLAIWIASFFGRSARWRQRSLSIQADGRIS